MTEPSAGWNQPPQPRKQGSSIAKGCLISAAIVVVLGIVLIVVVAFAAKDSADKVQRRLQTTTPAGEQVVISLDEFNRVQNGMSLADVEGIIGGPGRVSSEFEGSGGVSSIGYQWGGEDLGANAIIIFRNDAVTSKTQIGLT